MNILWDWLTELMVSRIVSKDLDNVIIGLFLWLIYMDSSKCNIFYISIYVYGNYRRYNNTI